VVAAIRTPEPIERLEPSCRKPITSSEKSPAIWSQHYRDFQRFRVHHRRPQRVTFCKPAGTRTWPASGADRGPNGGEGLITLSEDGASASSRNIRSNCCIRCSIRRHGRAWSDRTDLPSSPCAQSSYRVVHCRSLPWPNTNCPVILVRAEHRRTIFTEWKVAKGSPQPSRGGMTATLRLVVSGMALPCVPGAGSIEVIEPPGGRNVCGCERVIKVVLKEATGFCRSDGVVRWVMFTAAKPRLSTQTRARADSPRSWATRISFRGSFGGRATPISRATPRPPQFGAEGLGLCRTSTCSSPKIACRSCSHDLSTDEKSRVGPCEAASHAALRFRRTVRRGRLPRW